MGLTILFSLFFLPMEKSSATVSKSAKLTLFAKSGKDVLWSMSLEGSSSCTLSGSQNGKPEIRFPEAKQLRSEECKTLLAVRDRILQELKLLIQQKQKRLRDEPEYELLAGEVQFPVLFQAPGECEMTPEGKFKNCKQNPLTSAQELLLFLRIRAQSLGWLGGRK